MTLGTAEEGCSRRRAEAELRHVLADVERGIWRPYEPPPAPAVREAPTFHEFASEWMENREPELRPKTVTSYRWMLSGHLLPHFAPMRLDRIGSEDVDRYKATKLREGALGANQINKSIGLLAMILDAAGDYGHTDPARNPARGRRRRVKRTTPKRPTVEPEQLPSLLEAARKLRPVVATMAGAGLRCGEVCALDWADFDLPAAPSPSPRPRPMPGSARSICRPRCGANWLRTSSARPAAARGRCSRTASDRGRASATSSGG